MADNATLRHVLDALAAYNGTARELESTLDPEVRRCLLAELVVLRLHVQNLVRAHIIVPRMDAPMSGRRSSG
jgi:hypothetical protein